MTIKQQKSGFGLKIIIPSFIVCVVLDIYEIYCHTIIVSTYPLNINKYRNDSSKFNYHSTIMICLFPLG